MTDGTHERRRSAGFPVADPVLAHAAQLIGALAKAGE